MKNPSSYVLALLFAGCILLLSACSDDETAPDVFPDLAEGTYSLQIHDARGKLVFERRGEAFGTGPEATIRMDDPQFLTETSETDKFAMLLINTSPDGDRPWNAKTDWTVQTDSMPVLIRQRFYSMSGDWSYEGISGSVTIIEASENHLKGSFRIQMRVDDASGISESIPGFNWTANPQWGDRITLTGYFRGKHY